MSSDPRDRRPRPDDAPSRPGRRGGAAGGSLASPGGGLRVEARYRAALEACGVRAVADVLRRSECVRDLPGRANLRLGLERVLVHVKHEKPGGGRWRAPRVAEADGLARARLAGVPVPDLVFEGFDAGLGAVTGTADLPSARPLDEVLRRGDLSGPPRERLLRGLARAVARLHDAGLHHRDLYLNHVLVEAVPAAPRRDPLVAILDWDRLGRHRRPLGRWVVKDLAALLASVPDGTVTARERLRFLLLYLAGRGRDAHHRARRLARRVGRKAARMRAHAPRTPVGDAARPGAGRGDA